MSWIDDHMYWKKFDYDAAESYRVNCGCGAAKCAEGDLLGKALELLHSQLLADGHSLECICSQGKDRQLGREPQCIKPCRAIKAILAKAKGE